MTSVESVRFLKHVPCQVGTDLLVVWDGLPVPRGLEVRSFLAE